MLECCYGKKHEPARCLHKDIIDKYGGKILFLEYITSNDRPSADGAGWRTVILFYSVAMLCPGLFSSTNLLPMDDHKKPLCIFLDDRMFLLKDFDINL